MILLFKMMLRDYEMMGTTTEYKGCPKPTEVDGRRIIGVNIPENDPAWHNLYSISLADMRYFTECMCMERFPSHCF